jgi:hypothetical protein
MDDQPGRIERKILFAICLTIAGILIVVFLFIRDRRMDRGIMNELATIGLMVNVYLNENYDLYPFTLDFLDEPKYRKDFQIVELDRVGYVWPGEEPWNFGDLVYDQKGVDCMKQLYGDFGFEVGVLSSPVRMGMPVDHVILLTYEKKNIWGKNWAYVCFVAGNYGKYPPEEVATKIVLQNAYLRVPVNISDADILKEALNDEKSSFRFRSAEALAKLGIPEGRAFLEEAFESSDVFAKIKAADSLARMDNNEARMFLHDVYATSDEECVKGFVEDTLDEVLFERARLGLPVNEMDISYLLQGLERRDYWSPFQSAEALVRLGIPEGREFLDRHFQGDDPAHRLYAARWLALLGDEVAIGFLAEVAERDVQPYNRHFAEGALNEIGQWPPNKVP